MPCTINNNSAIRRLYFKCSTETLTKYNIPNDKKKQIESENFLVISLDSGQYRRLEEGEKSQFKDSFRKPFIIPKNIRVGFSASIDDTSLNVRRCLEFLAISSIATSNTGVYTPVTVLDYIRPEIEDDVFTRRQGQLIISSGTGFSGSNSLELPQYTEQYDISFLEIFKRLII